MKLQPDAGHRPEVIMDAIDSRELKSLAARRFVAGLIALGALFFIPAGTFRFWEAWVYLAVLFIPIALVFTYLIRNDRELLERRLRMKEKEEKQKAIQKVGAVLYLIGFLLPGLDRRLGWSSVPLPVVMVADVVVLLGYVFFFFVLRANSFASRVIEVHEEQRVITTGPYSLVRHPMYLAISLMLVFTPLALGSAWALIPFALAIVLLVARARNEEDILSRDLPGYREYMQRTRYRLIPGIW
jgi:protein-S-isoprenylcysteine O-methyltransferase Ste14